MSQKHSAEVSTLYPHHGIRGLALPFGWTNGIPAEPSHCHETLPATPTNSPLGLSHGWPRCLPKTSNGHRRGKTNLRSQTGTRYHNNNNWHTRLMFAYLIKVARAHNLPSLEAPARGMTIDPVKTFP